MFDLIPANHAPRATAFALLLLLFPIAPALGEATSDGARKTFDVPAGDAAVTIKEFSRQSNRQVMFPTEPVNGIETNAIKGEYSPKHALDMMLAGTALIAIEDQGSGTFAVKLAQDPNSSRAPAGSGGSGGNPAENEDSGAISGTVSSSQTHDLLQGVTVSIPALNRMTATDGSGSFRFGNLPRGPVELVVSYTDFQEDRRTVLIEGSQHLALELTPSSPITLPKFTVASEVEGNALAVTKQRDAPNLLTVMALDTDLTATMPNMDTGDLVTRISGVAPSYGQGTVNNVSIRGMDSTLTRMTFDGLSSVSAVDGRRPTFVAFSGSLFEELEVIKGQTPEMSADSIGGTINAVTRSPLNMTDNLRIDYNIGARWAAPFFYRPTYEAQRAIEPLTEFSYQEVFNVLGGQRNLGIALSTFFGQNLNETAKLTNQREASAASPAYDWDTRTQEQLDDRYVDGLNFKAEFRPSDASKFFFSYLFNEDNEPGIDLQSTRAFTGQAIATLDASGNPTGTGGILPGFTDSITQVRAVAGSNFTLSSYHESVNYKENAFTLGGEHILGNWKFDYTGRYNLTHVNDGTGNDGSGGVLTMTDPTIGYTINRTDPVNPILTQTAGPSIYNLASYTNTVSFQERNDTLDSDIAEGIANAAYEFDSRYPLTLKAGVAYKNQEYKIDQRDPRMWTPVAGAQFLPPSSLSYMPPTQYLYGYPMVDSRSVNLLVSNPTLWTENTYYRVSTDYSGSSGVTENIEAEYAMATLKINRLTILAGARLEQTHDVANAFVEVPPATAAQIPDQAARAIHDWDHPVTNRGSYDRAFPSVHLTYNLTRDLVARASWSTSFGRPPFSDLVPTATINNTVQTVTTGNPGLGPEYSKNLDFAMAYYFKPAGYFSVGYFKKNITDFIATQDVGTVGTGPDNGYQGNYAGYQLLTDFNLGSANVAGWEFDYRQQLIQLPGLLKGLGLAGNLTLLQTQGNYGGATSVSGGQLPGFIPKSGTASVTYDYGAFETRVILNYVGPYLVTLGASQAVNIYYGQYCPVSLYLSYRVRPELSFYCQVQNVFQQPLTEYEDIPSRQYLRQIGPSHVTFGIKGTF